MSQRAKVVATTTLVLIVSALLSYSSTHATSCSAAEYCPNGWRVQRKSNYDATTCDPMTGVNCDKPYQCVHSMCGMSFCCVHQKALDKWKEEMEIKQDMEDEDGDDERNEF